MHIIIVVVILLNMFFLGLPLQKCNTSMDTSKSTSMMDKSPKQISTEVSRESAKASSVSPSMQRTSNLEDRTDTALPLKQNTSRRENKKKSPLITPSKKHICNRKTRAHSTPPSPSKQWILNQNRAHSASPSPLKQSKFICKNFVLLSECYLIFIQKSLKFFYCIVFIYSYFFSV